MSQFMNTFELRMMRRDFERMLLSPECNDITIKYYTTNAAEVTEPPFHIDSSDIDQEPKETTMRAMQKILKERDIKAFASQVLEVGDCLFYFSVKVAINEPVESYPVVDGTLWLIDPSGVEWVPITISDAEKKKFLGFSVGNQQYAQVMACTLKK